MINRHKKRRPDEDANISLKTFKRNIKQFVNDSRSEDGPSINSKNANADLKSRKLLRKENRKLKKMRVDAFKRKLPLPTLETIEQDKNQLAEIKKKRKEKLKKLRQKRLRKKEKKILKNQEEEDRIKDLEILNKQDNKVLKDLEKKLHIKKKKDGTLPSSFQHDNMDYILNYLDEAKGTRHLFQEKEDEYDDDTNEANSEDDANDDEDDNEDDDDDDDDVDDDRSSCDESKTVDEKDFTSDEDNHIDMSCDDNDSSDDDAVSNSNRLVSNTSDVKKSKTNNTVSRSHDKTKLGVSNASIVPNEKDAINKAEVAKEKKIVGLKEDIYGRLRDERGNVVGGDVYLPPAKRKALQNVTLDDKLRKQIHSIVNRLTETTMAIHIKELLSIFAINSRAAASDTLTSEIISSSVINSLLPVSSLSNYAFVIAVLHSAVGVEVSSTFLQMLSSSLISFLKLKLIEDDNQMMINDDDLDDDDINDDVIDDSRSNKIKNALSIFCKLFTFRVIESPLIFELIDHLMRFSFLDIISLDFIIKDIGFILRKEDTVSFKNFYSNIINKSVELENSGGKKMMLYKNLLDNLKLIKNNQKHKMTDYDQDSNDNRLKELKVLTKGNQLPAIHVTLKDLALSQRKGKWWLVGSAWAGREDEDAKNLTMHMNSEHDATLQKFEKKLLEKARAHHMNTSVKKMIFCTIMTCTDYMDSFEKLLRLKLSSEQQREIMRVILNLVVKETPYNQFYALLSQQFCSYHRKFMMACKFSIWDQLKTIENLSEKQMNCFSDYILQLIANNALQLPVIKVIDFAEITKPMVHFLTRFLTSYFASPNISMPVIETTFAHIASNIKLARFKTGISLFMQRFIVRDVEALNNEAVKTKVKKACYLLDVSTSLDAA